MQFSDKRPELGGGAGRPRAPGIVLKVLAVAASAVMLVSAIIVSLVLFAGLLVLVLVGGGYLWWKTRHVRAEIKAAQHDSSIIEGEVIRRDMEDVQTSLDAPARDDAALRNSDNSL